MTIIKRNSVGIITTRTGKKVLVKEAKYRIGNKQIPRTIIFRGKKYDLVKKSYNHDEAKEETAIWRKVTGAACTKKYGKYWYTYIIR